jgi:hypothetical protein
VHSKIVWFHSIHPAGRVWIVASIGSLTDPDQVPTQTRGTQVQARDATKGWLVPASAWCLPFVSRPPLLFSASPTREKGREGHRRPRTGCPLTRGERTAKNSPPIHGRQAGPPPPHRAERGGGRRQQQHRQRRRGAGARGGPVALAAAHVILRPVHPAPSMQVRHPRRSRNQVRRRGPSLFLIDSYLAPCMPCRVLVSGRRTGFSSSPVSAFIPWFRIAD